MQNCKTSARTTVKQSSKSSLLFRQPCILAMLLLCAVSSCQQKQDNKIVVIKTLVCDDSCYGLVGSGSIFFDYNKAKKGYLIQLKNGEELIRNYFCLPDDLKFNIEKIRYEYIQKDSIIILPSK